MLNSRTCSRRAFLGLLAALPLACAGKRLKAKTYRDAAKQTYGRLGRQTYTEMGG